MVNIKNFKEAKEEEREKKNKGMRGKEQKIKILYEEIKNFKTLGGRLPPQLW